MTPTSTDTGSGFLSVLRRATQTPAERVPTPRGVGRAVWVVAMLAVIVFCLWPDFEPLPLASGALSLRMAYKARRRIRRLWADNNALWWAVPAVTLLSAWYADTLGPVVLLFPPGAAALIVLWNWSPWLGGFAEHCAALAGWGRQAPSPLAVPDVEPADIDGLTSVDRPDDYPQCHRAVMDQLAELDGWSVLPRRWSADAVATGPGGVAAIYSVDLPGLQLESIDSPDMGEEEILRRATVSFREETGVLVAGSETTELLESPNAERLDVAEIVDRAHHDAVSDAGALVSEFVDADGYDVGIYLPAVPSIESGHISNLVGMGADHQVVTVLVAHDVVMDSRWGRVQVFDSVGTWRGWAVLCHPRHVTECVNALPGVFASHTAVVAAQHAVELRTRDSVR